MKKHMRKVMETGREMIRRRFILNGFLVVGIVLSLALLGQPALADGGECAPFVKAVYMNFNDYLIIIYGECFDNGDRPEVTLDDVELEVIHHTATEIYAHLLDVPGGDSVLSVGLADDDIATDRFWIRGVELGPQDELPSGGFVGGVQWYWHIDGYPSRDSGDVGITVTRRKRSKRPKWVPKDWVYNCYGKGKKRRCYWEPPLEPIPTCGTWIPCPDPDAK
jgi:hypothetical protein